MEPRLQNQKKGRKKSEDDDCENILEEFFHNFGNAILIDDQIEERKEQLPSPNIFAPGSPINKKNNGLEDFKSDPGSPIEKFDINCKNEQLDPNEIKMLNFKGNRFPYCQDYDHDYKIGVNLKKFFQSRKEYFAALSNDIATAETLSVATQASTLAEMNPLYTLRQNYSGPIKSILPHEPYIRLTVLRNSMDKHVVNEFYITPRGMVNSTRNTAHDDIVVGRQQSTPEGVIPNDICLFYTDRAISRVHCKIITKYGFNNPREIPSNFLAFLSMSHKQKGVGSLGYCLPNSLYRHIYSFLKPKKKFWIVDLGSVFGTYVKIKGKTNINALEKGHTYLVGADTYFNVMKVNQPGQKSKSQDRIKMGEEEEFMKFLFREKFYNKTEIHGLSKNQLTILNQMIANHKARETEEENNETEMIEPSFDIPYLKIEVQNCTALHIPPDHLFVAGERNEFVVGRMNECDININQNTISRKQCRFLCNDGRWFVADGAQNKESSNGTWIALTDFRLKRERMESEPRELENGSEIKISDTILKLEIINND